MHLASPPVPELRSGAAQPPSAAGAAQPPSASVPATSQRRRTQIIATALVAVGASAAASLATGHLGTLSVLAVVGALLALSLAVARRGAAVLAWRGAGLYDPALLALPGLLIFAVMLGQRSLFVGLLLVVMLARTAGLLIGHWQGLREFAPALAARLAGACLGHPARHGVLCLADGRSPAPRRQRIARPSGG